MSANFAESMANVSMRLDRLCGPSRLLRTPQRQRPEHFRFQACGIVQERPHHELLLRLLTICHPDARRLTHILSCIAALASSLKCTLRAVTVSRLHDRCGHATCHLHPTIAVFVCIDLVRFERQMSIVIAERCRRCR